MTSNGTCAIPTAAWSNRIILNIENSTANTWMQKADLGFSFSNVANRRHGAVGFSIGNKGYIGTGFGVVNNSLLLTDFWEYDPVSNTWTQRADFAGVARRSAVGFSIGNKGYIGTGIDASSVYKNDFWEYNPITNAWTPKANYGGGSRVDAVGFSIGSKGYIGSGYSLSSPTADFWEYDPLLDSWTRRADFAGTARSSAVGFSIGSFGYIGTGFDNLGAYKKDFWQYDPATNTWVQKADFGGLERSSAVGMAIGNKGYIGTGIGTLSTAFADFWEYDPATNAWSARVNFANTTSTRYNATCFSIGGIGYVGTGTGNLQAHADLWSFNPASNTWTQVANMGIDIVRSNATGFSTANKGYVISGWQGNYQSAATLTHLWEYDPNNNSWTKKANFFSARLGMVSFGIGNKGYIGLGSDIFGYTRDFWEYNPVTNAFTQKANFGGAARNGASGFSIGEKGYIGCGYDGAYKNDFWEYDPNTNIWTQKANFGGVVRSGGVGFSIRNKGYLGAGITTGGTYLADFWEYDPVTNGWTQKANVGPTPRQNAFGFSIDQKGYIGTGSSSTAIDLNDFWEYDPVTNVWTARASMSKTRETGVGFSIGNKGYVGTGLGPGASHWLGDFWEYTPVVPTLKTGSVSVGPYCPGQTVTIPFTTGCAPFNAGNIFSAQLSDSAGNFSTPYSLTTISSTSTQITAQIPSVLTSSNNYLIRVVSSNPATIGLPTAASITVNANASLVLTSSATSINQSLCAGISITPITYIARGITTVTFSGLPTGVTATYAGNVITISGLPSVTGNFPFTINAVGPCTSTSASGTIIINSNNNTGITISSNIPIVNLCSGTMITFTASIVNGGTTPVYQWKLNGANIGTNSNTLIQSLNYGQFIECTLTSNATCPVPQTVWSNRIYGSDLTPTLNQLERIADVGFTQLMGPEARQGAFSFTIGTKGYVGGGENQQNYLNDFWEYNPTNSVWTQRANLPTQVSGAVAFSIGRKGYMGTGNTGNFLINDFWEYDPAANSWSPKATFPGSIRKNAVGFSINEKGYVGTGSTSLNVLKDFWEYNPITNTWASRASLTGVAREKAVGFSLQGKGYITTGASSSGNLADLWEYNPVTNTWVSKTNFSGSARSGAAVFTVGTKAYVGTGFDGTNRLSDFWMYDPSLNSWTARTGLPTNPLQRGVGFSTASNGYLVSGENGSFSNELWEYDTIANSWTRKQAFGGSARQSAVGFSIRQIGYIGTGLQNGIRLNDFWAFDPSNNTWSQKADFAGSPRNAACGFSIGNFGYLGTGFDGNSRLNDFWVYNPSSNTWVQKANFGGNARRDAVGFSIGNRGYIGTGLNGTTRFNDFWEYDPATDTWVQRANVGGVPRNGASGFSIYNKGYIGTGTDGVGYLDDFWEYDPSNDSWVQKANFPGSSREGAGAFSIGTNGYFLAGKDGTSVFSDLWQFQQSSNTWSFVTTNLSYFSRVSPAAFSIGNRGYFGTGVNGTTLFSDFWEFRPNPLLIKTGTVVGPLCAGSIVNVPYQIGCINATTGNVFSVQLSDSAGSFASPIVIGTSISILNGTIASLIPDNMPAGNRYRVRVVSSIPEAIGTDNGIDLTINSSVTPTIQIQSLQSVTQICPPTVINFSATSSNVGNAPTYRWKKNGIDVGTNLSNYSFSDWGIGDFVECELTSNATCALPRTVISNRINIDHDSLNNGWQQKATLGFNQPLITNSFFQNASHRNGAISFSVGERAYIGLGNTGTYYYNDLWSYDPVNNTWNQRASYPLGWGISSAVAFSIGSKAYVATGFDGTGYSNAMYEYDANNNTWTTKASMPTSGRTGAIGFAIAGKGYVGAGYNGVTVLGDFWVFDPVANTWIPRNTFSGFARQGAVSFSIGSKGYMGTGNTGVRKDDFWEYDPATNGWIAKSNFPGVARDYGVGFVISNMGYVGCGNTGSYSNDFYKYNPLTDGWSLIASMPSAREKAFSFSTFGKGYVGNGFNGLFLNDFYSYDPLTNSWSLKSDQGALHRKDAIGFALGNKGYIGTGINAMNQPMNDFWEFDYQLNAWTQKADFAGAARSGAVGFSIGYKGYVGTGLSNTTYLNDFWEYNPITNAWLQKASLPGGIRNEAIGFGIGFKGYVGTGKNATSSLSDFWEYDPATDTWLAKAAFAGGVRYAASAFSMNSKGYVGTGFGTAVTNDFWEYNPASNTWTAKATVPGNARMDAVGFSFQSANVNQSTMGIIGSGSTSVGVGMKLNDFHKYDPILNTWTTINFTSAALLHRSNAVGFVIGSRGFVGTGLSGGPLLNDFWEMNPFGVSVKTGNAVPSAICPGGIAQVPISSGCNFNQSIAYVIELSDSIGSFSNPTIIGSGSFVNTALVNVTIPSNTPTGQFYKMRVVAQGVNSAPGFESPSFITIKSLNTISLSSAIGTINQSKCINTAITNITYTTTGATGATITGLPAGVIGSFGLNTVTISGSPTVSGTFNYTVSLTGGCGAETANGSITVTANNTISFSSAAGTNAQTKCINTPITNIFYTTTGATGATVTGMPAGVTGIFGSNTVTISGTPTVSGVFNYTVTLTGGCGTITANGSITVTANNTISLSSAIGTNNQTKCINTAITNITYTTTGATGATITGLPAGVIGSFGLNTVTISGSPTVSGTFNYTVTLTGGCGTATANGSITVTANNIISLSSLSTSNQTRCINTAITNIIYTTIGAVGATVTGLPTGVTGSFASDTVTISGTPTASGTFNYTVTLIGGCGNTTANGIITVTANKTISLSSAIGTNNQTKCINTAITNITYTTTGATGATVTGLPTGVTGSFASNTVTISGIPSVSGTFNYTVTLTGGCGTTTANGSITVSANTISFSSAISTNYQTICINTAITNITYSTTGATGATVTGLPTGVTGSFASNTVTISGTPTVSGAFNYTVTLTGGCGTTTANGGMTVRENNTISLSSALGTNNQTKCINSSISNIIYFTTGASSVSVTGLPVGVVSTFGSNTVTISGAPNVSGTYDYTVTLLGGCGTAIDSGTITVNDYNSISLSSGVGTNVRTVCLNAAITDITYSTTVATGAIVSGLPLGLTGNFAANTFTITGAPTEIGTFDYIVELTGGCGNLSANGRIMVVDNNTITLSSSAGSDNQTLCINTPLSNIAYFSNNTFTIGPPVIPTNSIVTGLPTGVTGTNDSAGHTLISGTPTVSGVFNYTVQVTGGCGSVSATGSITVSPLNTITLSSAAGTNAQTRCINTAITNITYITTGATGATVTGLPAGVTGSFAANTVTISGTPTVSGPFGYTVTLTGGCGTITANGSITVTANNTISLSSAIGTNNQSKCINTAITTITYTTNGATGATVTGLPTGVTGSFASNTVTISGTPTASGTFNYTITLTGGCGTITANGSITVRINNSIALSSVVGTNAQTRCINTSITNITYTTTGATGSTVTGLPTGVTGSFAANTVTISGTPTASGTFNYTVTLTGGCGTTTANGSITVTANNTISLSSAVGTNNQTKCINTAITNITYTTTGATGAIVSGLPTGVTGSFASNTVFINGTPSVSGPFNYTITLTGGCGTTTANGSITVTANNTISLSSAVGTNNQTKCINTAITNITYTTTGATGATITGLPTGVTGSFASNTVTISGTASVSGPFNYTITLTGGCGTTTANGSITVTANNTISLSSAVGTNNQTKCINTAITNITYTTTGATGATITGLPTGVTGSFASNTVTISGTPSVSGTFNYTVTLTGGCGNISTNGTLTLNAISVITAQPSSTEQHICLNTTPSSLSVTATGTSLNYQWFENTLAANTGGTQVVGATLPSFIPSSASAGTFYYYIVVSGACGPAVTSAVSGAQIIKPTGTWLGATTNWHQASNWCGGIPIQTSNCIIPAATVNMPVISTSIAFVNNISIENGMRVQLINQTLKLSGLLSGVGFLQADSGTLELNGTAPQSISGSRLLNNIIGTLIISNNQGVSLSGTNDTLKIKNLLRFGNSNCTLNTNGNLTISSDSTGTASVGDMTSDGTLTGIYSGNRIEGNTTVERYIPNHTKAWQFLGIPTVGQSIKQTWMENNIPLGNTKPGYGGLITTNLGANNAGAQLLGFDLYSPNGPGMKYYNQAMNSWTGVNNANDPINNTQGYMVFIRGDRSVTAFNQPATATTLRTTGQLKTPLNNPPSVINVPASRFVSIGNPYASAIDFSKVSRTGGVQDLFYVWDPLLSPGYGFGAYQTFIRSGAGYLVVPGGGSYSSGNTRIESGAAFFVRANSTGSGTVTISESSKVNGSNLVTRNTTADQSRLYVLLRSGLNNALLDGVLSEMDTANTILVDALDAWKVGGSSGEQMSIHRASTLLSVERMPLPQVGDTIFYRLGQLRRQSYMLNWIPELLATIPVQPILVDRYLSIEQPLLTDDTTNYQFSVNTDTASASSDRFYVVFRPMTPVPVMITDIRANRVNRSMVTVSWIVDPEIDVVDYEVESSMDGRWFRPIGSAFPLNNDGSLVHYAMTDAQAPAGVAFYRVKVRSLNGNILYTKTVSVQGTEQVMQFSVDPNPIENSRIRISMCAVKKGNYRLRLIDNAGKEMKVRQLSLTEGDQFVDWPITGLAGGAYLLQIIAPDGSIFNNKVIIP